MIVAGIARCDIKRRSWSPPARPASCPPEVDYGQGMEVGGSGAGTLVCAGDTTLDPTAPSLAYGSETVIGRFQCSSRRSGLTCTEVETGHGFFISIQSYRTF
jgi:hypothetical protein